MVRYPTFAELCHEPDQSRPQRHINQVEPILFFISNVAGVAKIIRIFWTKTWTMHHTLKS